MLIQFAEDHDQWAKDFQREMQHLNVTLSAYDIEIEHIGSTAVAGLAAKPVIDVQVGVRNLEDFDSTGGTERMKSAGYSYLPEFETMAPFRRLFVRDEDGIRRCNIHLVARDHPWYQRHLYFRNYLRSSASARQRYESVKRNLAEREWNVMSDYAAAKTGIVLALEEEAFDHFQLSDEYRIWVRGSRV